MTASCPRCGGSDLRQITPGFFECVTQVQVGAIPPGTHGNPVHLPVTGPCRHRFQVGTAVQTDPCFCGRDSIGTCVDCERRLCGLHGTSSGEFVCGACLRERADRAAVQRREQHEAEMAGVRKRSPVNESVPADLSGAPPTPARGNFGDAYFIADHQQAQFLWADGERRGYAALVGLAWTERRPNADSGTDWQIVHNYTHVRRGRRTIRGFLRAGHAEGYVAVKLDCWTAYAHSQAEDRLCDIRQFRGEELLEYWRSLRGRADGSHDFRWEPVTTVAPPQNDTKRVAVPLTDNEPLFAQLAASQAAMGLETWVGLTWSNCLGQACRVVDDVMVQASHTGLPSVYRTIVVDKDEGGGTVDREILRADAVEHWFDEVGRELEGVLQKARFEWPGRSGSTKTR